MLGKFCILFHYVPEENEDTKMPDPKVSPTAKPTIPDDPDDDFSEPLGELQPDANDAIVCEGGCQ